MSLLTHCLAALLKLTSPAQEDGLYIGDFNGDGISDFYYSDRNVAFLSNEKGSFTRKKGFIETANIEPIEYTYHNDGVSEVYQISKDLGLMQFKGKEYEFAVPTKDGEAVGVSFLPAGWQIIR